MSAEHALLKIAHTDEGDAAAQYGGRAFRAECSCGWVSIWRSTNACGGNWRRHVAAVRRAAAR